MARFCTKCGSGITPGSKFCNSCGNPVENGFEENRPAQNISAPVVPEKPTGHNNMLIIALVVVALLIGGIGGYLIFGRSSGDKNTAAKPQPNLAQQAEQAAKPADNAPVPKEVPKAEKEAFIVGTEVNARGSASTESTIVGTFKLGEKVTIISEEPEWAKVRRSDGKECYVFKKYLGDQAALNTRRARYSIKSGPYPVFLNGDPNYILVDAQMGGAWYLVRNSIKSKETNGKTIYAIVAFVNDADKGNVKIEKQEEWSFYFDNKGEMAGTASVHAIINFRYGTKMLKNYVGAMTYYIATGRKWAQFGFGDDFYSRADL